MTYYSPAETADKSGFSIDTLRYYEKIGLLSGIARNAAGRRVFSDDDLARLHMLRCLRDTGMPIAEMQRFAELVRVGERTLPDRVALLQEHDRRVEEKIARLRSQQGHLQWKIGHYREIVAAASGQGRCAGEPDGNGAVEVSAVAR